ncbi:hypothetical protein TIFTF001_050659 [Ficus carica]|uniref:Uncharacterized protein n=1 Tax=Ficus carica TaxID=3494 RepID=A0AA88CQ47_FICCA|nr:hypothetical protein TIFTF001_050659 [Ficus carica]
MWTLRMQLSCFHVFWQSRRVATPKWKISKYTPLEGNRSNCMGDDGSNAYWTNHFPNGKRGVREQIESFTGLVEKIRLPEEIRPDKISPALCRPLSGHQIDLPSLSLGCRSPNYLSFRDLEHTTIRIQGTGLSDTSPTTTEPLLGWSALAALATPFRTG